MAPSSRDRSPKTDPPADSVAGSEERAELLLHASAIAWQSKALVFTGPSGSGKSTLCLMLMAYGARLIADDRVMIRRLQDRLSVCAPPQMGGMVEARGVGLLGAVRDGTVEHGHDLAAIVRLDRSEPQRLPPDRQTQLLGLSAPEIWQVEGPHFAPALLQFLKEGRLA